MNQAVQDTGFLKLEKARGSGFPSRFARKNTALDFSPMRHFRPPELQDNKFVLF